MPQGYPPHKNFDECIRNFLKAVAGFPKIGNQLICWLCAAKKPAFMPMHEFMQHCVQLLSYLNGGYLCQMMDCPQCKRRAHNFLAQPKAHQYKFAESNKMVPMDPLHLVAFFEQCQIADKSAGVLDKLKEKKQLKEKKITHLPIACSHDLNYRHHRCKNRNYHQSN
jgi:hypothetical protein